MQSMVSIHHSLKVHSQDPILPEIGAKSYNFTFENLVLAGGGAKGVAYCGAARELEQHGILEKIKRFAGTSAGAIVAALLCIGFNSYDIEEIMRINMNSLLIDSWFFQKLPNMIQHYGLNSAATFSEFIRDVIAIKTKKPDITFKEVYDQFEEKELCIIVTNANTMSEEYCHWKTTPNMPIWEAIRMSVSIPVLLTPVYTTGKDCDEKFYVDGGVLCNYPIHCFDEGSTLSMDGDPSKRQTNKLATLGCLVYADDEYHTFRDKIEKKCKLRRWIAPDTKLGRRNPDERIEKSRTDCHFKLYEIEKKEIMEMFNADSGEKKEFSLEDFGQILKKAWRKQEQDSEAKKDPFCRAGTYFKLLYGEDVEPKQIFDKIQRKDETKVTKLELAKFADIMCSELFNIYQSKMLKYEKIASVYKFYTRLFTGLMTATMTNFVKADDVARTVGINTGYIKMIDFDMEDGDKQFLIEQGQRSTEEFLKQFVHDNDLKPDCKSEREVKHHGTSLSAEDLEKIKKKYRF